MFITILALVLGLELYFLRLHCIVIVIKIFSDQIHSFLVEFSITVIVSIEEQDFVYELCSYQLC